MARRKIIAGNWKMNKTPSETVKLIEELKPLVNNEDVDVVFCVPAISLTTALEAAKGTNIAIGAEPLCNYSRLQSSCLNYNGSHPCI